MARPPERIINGFPAHHVSDTPSLQGMVFNVWPNGLEIVRDETLIMTSGLATFMAWVFFEFVALEGLRWISMYGPGPISVVISGFGLLCAWVLLRWDTLGYRYCPVLFDRAARKVHVFMYRPRLLIPWPIVGGKYEILSCDWDCVRAGTESYIRKDIVSRSGATVERPATRLWLMVTKAPDDLTIVHQIDLGMGNDAMLGHRLFNTWEYLRRYMQHEEAPLEQGDHRYRPSQTSLWGSLTLMQPFIGPGAKKNWQERNEVKWLSQVMWLAQIVAGLLFPLTMAVGLVRWVLFRIKRQPRWPDAILASVGGRPLQSDHPLQSRLR